ncbi:hypothetical protein V5740_10680 [Croceibacterium sp. TMG7-5b_MA50]|uniref:hypothetical protein n=1 Tax=Croceibacterium sp. TMG7-5b_MA50 TaxID=3121290 RepID=UPI00322220BF
MMAVAIRDLPLHAATLDALVTALALAEAEKAAAEFSFDPQSDYRRAKAVIDDTLLLLRALSVSMLRQIDEEIAASDLVAELTERAFAAEEEAGRLRALSATIADVAQVVGRIAGVVAGVARLPFV